MGHDHSEHTGHRGVASGLLRDLAGHVLHGIYHHGSQHRPHGVSDPHLRRRDKSTEASGNPFLLRT